MLAKQLNRQKYESFDYGKFDRLRKVFLEPNFEPLQIEEIDLSNEKSHSMPNTLCLNLLPNLKVLVLANNQIGRFPGAQVAKELQALQILDLSNNLIEELDDIADMNLPNLRVLDYQGNFVCTYLQRITQIQQLLCPKRYEKYNPVKIFTASYNQLPVGKLTEAAYIQEQKDIRTLQRKPEEFKPEELMNTVSKYSHKNTLGKHALEICPIPRKTRFRCLEYLNGEIISKLDIIRVAGVKDFRVVLESSENVKQVAQKMKKSKAHDEYIRKYTKRVNRLLEDNVRTHDPDEVLKAPKKKTLDPKKFSVWETPLDIQYKDSEFTIAIEDFKKEQREHQQQKRLKEEKRKKRVIERIKKKHPSFEEDDSDPDLRRMLNDKKNRVRPKLNLSADESKIYRSSESSLACEIEDDDDCSSSKESQTQLPQTPKTAAQVQSSSINQLKQHLMERRQSQTTQNPTSAVPDPQKTITRSQTANKIRSQEAVQQSEDRTQEKPRSPTSSAFRRNVQSHQHFRAKAEPNVVAVPYKPIPAIRILTKLKCEENRSTFDVNNKLSSPHPVVREGDLKEQMMKKMQAVKEVVQKERIELEHIQQQARKAAEAPKPTEETVQTQPKRTRIIIDPKKGKIQRAQEPPQREIVRVHGDLDKVEYQRIQIPLEQLIPTEEQGVPEKYRQEFLFDVDSEAHKDLLHYKQILEDSMNLVQAWKEMDQKLQILGAVKPDKELKFKANDYNAVHKYLKDKYGKEKITPYEMREIIYGANDYDAQQEPKINDAEVAKKLKEENLPMEERQVLYKWVEILDDIRLRSIVPNEKRLRRMEIKEIERAQSFAHLAYHYQILKKYVSEEKLQQYVRMMGIPLNEILQQDTNNLKFSVKKKSQAVSRQSQSAYRSVKLPKDPTKERDLTKQMEKISEEKAQLLRDYSSINQVRSENIVKEIMNPNGSLAQNEPYQYDFLKKMEKIHNQVMGKIQKHQVSFESMVEQNLRKLQDQFLTKQGPSGLEEQMLRYASEFKEKIKKRERLQQNIKQHISDTRQKLDEFWLWEQKERELRYDEMAILMRKIKRLENEMEQLQNE